MSSKIDITDLNEEEREAFLEAMLESGGDTLARQRLQQVSFNYNELLAWATGTGNGMYPVTLPDGTIVTLPSPLKIAESAAESSLMDDPGDFTLIFENKLI